MQAKRLSDRNFGLIFAIVFGLIAVVVWLVNGSYQYWAAEIALVFPGGRACLADGVDAA